MFSFSSWPPNLTPSQREELHKSATTWALSHGLCYLPPPLPDSPPSASVNPPPASAIHAPISLLPAPFPKSSFLSAQRLQSTYNVLYSRIATDTEFLDRYMGCESEDGVGRVDSFTGKLWEGWKAVREEGGYERQVSVAHLYISHSSCALYTDKDFDLSSSHFTLVYFDPTTFFIPHPTALTRSNKLNSTRYRRLSGP